MNKYEIWMEGYRASGDCGTARFEGVWEGETFQEACQKWARATNSPQFYDPERNTYWCCRLYSNEIDARKRFG